MKNHQVVLLNIYYSESGYGDKLHFPTLGITYISEYSNVNNIEHNVIDMGLGYIFEQIFKIIKSIQPIWIGISINSLLISKTHNFYLYSKYMNNFKKYQVYPILKQKTLK